MRIVGGRLRGRALSEPKIPKSGVSAIRPTTDRIRESLFNILAHRIDINGARVLDVFAGTGALGIEALSRGASHCLFMETSREGAALVKQNLVNLGLSDIGILMRKDATRPGPIQNHEPMELVFADPPYGKGLGEKALKELDQNGWLSKEVLIVLEEASGTSVPALEGFELVDNRTYGNTRIILLQR